MKRSGDSDPAVGTDIASASDGRPSPVGTISSRLNLAFAMAGVWRNLMTKVKRHSAFCNPSVHFSQQLTDQRGADRPALSQSFGIRTGDKIADRRRRALAGRQDLVHYVLGHAQL